MNNKFGTLLIMLFSFSLVASEKDVYDFSWLDSDKEVYVLQNRKFRKKNKIYFGLTGTKNIDEPFVDSKGYSLKGGYFFKEEWGFELNYGANKGTVNATFDAVEESATIAFYRNITSYYGGMLLWSPFYAKINTFNKIFYYDWIFGAGMGSFETEDNRNEVEVSTNEDLTTETINGYQWLAAMRLYISQHWSLRLEVQGFHFQGDQETQTTSGSDTETNWFHFYDLGVGLNYSF